MLEPQYVEAFPKNDVDVQPQDVETTSPTLTWTLLNIITTVRAMVLNENRECDGRCEEGYKDQQRTEENKC